MHTEFVYFFVFVGLFLLITPDQYVHLPVSKKHKQILGIICLLVAYYYFNNEKLF
jgi:hypothetical protein